MKLKYIAILLLLLINSSCYKDFLDIKPDKSLVVPQRIKDLQALLDNTTMNMHTVANLGEVGADDYFLADDRWNTLTNAQERNTYIWAQEIFDGEKTSCWNTPYLQIYTANLVLEKLEDGNFVNDEAFRNVKGAALFFRAWAYYQLAQVFCPPYDKNANTNKYGLPIRLTADINKPAEGRRTVGETYAQILKDVEESIALLPEKSSIATRPSKQAALSLKAKCHLLQGNYAIALEAVDKAMQIDNTLLDYNDIDPTKEMPFDVLNEEVVFHNVFSAQILGPTRAQVNKSLYQSYTDIDLRKKLFFYFDKDGLCRYKGMYYNAPTILFSGIARDELYLIWTECALRSGNVAGARTMLATLLEKRYAKGNFDPLSLPNNREDLLMVILTERKKELFFRGVRWSDIRRLNAIENQEISLTRTLEGKTYTLLPKDKRFTFPIPDEAISLGHYPQNER